MRDARLPVETGGILFGLVDIPARRIHLVDATAAPPGSIEEPGGFVRGMGGVEEMMEDVRRRTAGQVRLCRRVARASAAHVGAAERC